MARARGLDTIVSNLVAARRALDAADDEAALSALVVAWRASRHDRIATLVEAASSRLGLDPIDDAASDFHVRWMAIAARRDPADLPRLIASSRGPSGSAPRSSTSYSRVARRSRRGRPIRALPG